MQATTSGSTSGSVADDDDARPAAPVAPRASRRRAAMRAAPQSLRYLRIMCTAVRAGSLRNVYVRVTYTDGTRSDGFVPSETLGPENRALLDYMSRRKEGAKIIKYLPEECQRLVHRRTD